MLLSQISDGKGGVTVVARSGSEAYAVEGATSTYALAADAAEAGHSLVDEIRARGFGAAVDLEAAYAEGRMLLPITHPDPAHCLMTGTGLTHLGSATTRDAMHAATAESAAANAPPQTDSMKMFRMGIEGGRPVAGAVGAQPEWFYKGDGSQAVAPGQPIRVPGFGADAGEEPEVAGIYLISADGSPFRVGFALGNELSDHITERGNYLWLAHSKLRRAAYGPEILVGPLPEDLRGTSRILRGGKVLWEKPFLSGEANMSHSLGNLEHHHFKYDLFRRPGDLHVHFFGTATLSFADGVRCEEGDVFEIEAAPFGLPLRNPLAFDKAASGPVTVRSL